MKAKKTYLSENSLPLSKPLKQLRSLLIDTLYPRSCLHCESNDLEEDHLLCSPCNDLLTPIDWNLRCPRCFSDNYHLRTNRCAHCLKRKSFISRSASIFEYLGPPASIIKQLKYSSKFFLAEGAGAFMAAQLLKSSWPLPDVIVPTPLSFSHYCLRGYNQSFLLAKALSRIISVPIQTPLSRSSLDYSQAGLSTQKRKSGKYVNIRLRNKKSLKDKTVLLIDDVSTTGTTLEKCAEALLEGYPASIWSLTFCRS